MISMAALPVNHFVRSRSPHIGQQEARVCQFTPSGFNVLIAVNDLAGILRAGSWGKWACLI